MDLDADIDRWRNQSRRSSYTTSYRRPSRDNYTADYDYAARSYFNEDALSTSSLGAHRRAPPPPPPPEAPRRPPPPPPVPSESSRNVGSLKKPARRAASSRRAQRHYERSTVSAKSAKASRTTRQKRSETPSSRSATEADTTDTESDSDSGSSTHTSSSSTASSSEATTASTSTATPTSSTSSTDTDSESSGSTATSSASTYSSVSVTSSHHARHRARRASLPKQLQSALVRVAQRPGSAAQDEEIAAAAACRAILEKETALKEKELRLLRQKKNFAAEVQRRSSLPHRFTNEDEALRQMQRLVDLEDAHPPLEEFLKRTATTKTITAGPAAPEKNALTDAGALAYLRSYDPAEASGSMPSVNRVGPTPGKAAPEEQKSTVKDGTDLSATAGDGSKAEPQTQHSPNATALKDASASHSANTAATTNTEDTAHDTHSSLEHSLPVEGHLLTASEAGTPTHRTGDSSHIARALAATVEKKREDADEAAAAVPALTIEADHTEEKHGAPLSASGTRDQRSAVSEAATSAKTKSEPVSPSKTSGKAAEAKPPGHAPHASEGPAERVIHIELPRRRVKVKVRRRRSQSRSQLRPTHTDSDDMDGDRSSDEEDYAVRDRSPRRSPAKAKRSPQRENSLPTSHHERRSSSAPSYPASASRISGLLPPPSLTPSEALPPPPTRHLMLLPPPPSPATNSVSNRQQFAVDPLYQFNPSASNGPQQPWTNANWPCGTGRSSSAGGVGATQKSKDGPPALWYASNSPVPLSQHEFKSLLCSEYRAPETTYAVAPEADGTRREAAVEERSGNFRSPEKARRAAQRGGRGSPAVPPLSSDAFTPERQRTGREVYEPYEETVEEETTAARRDARRSPPSAKARAASAAAPRRDRSQNENSLSLGSSSGGGPQRAAPRRRAVRVRDPAEEEAAEAEAEAEAEDEMEEEGEDDDALEAATEKPRGRGRGRAKTKPRLRGGRGRGRAAAAQGAAPPPEEAEEVYEDEEEDLYVSHHADATGSSPQLPPPHPTTPPAPVFAGDGESVVEFPPPPHLMASDMPPPGDVGSDGEDSCCGGCGCGGCSCWGRFFGCLFPCCCGPKKPSKPKKPKEEKHKKHKGQQEAAGPVEPERPLAFQRPEGAPFNPVNAPTQVLQQEPYTAGAIRYLPDPSATPQEQQHQQQQALAQQQQIELQQRFQQQQQQLQQQGPPVAQVQRTPRTSPHVQFVQPPVSPPPAVNSGTPPLQPLQQQQQQQPMARPPAGSEGGGYSTGAVGNVLPGDPASVNGLQG